MVIGEGGGAFRPADLHGMTAFDQRLVAKRVHGGDLAPGAVVAELNARAIGAGVGGQRWPGPLPTKW